MTGKSLIDKYFTSSSIEEKETVKEAMSYYIENKLSEISNGKLDLDTELKSDHLKQLISAIDKDFETGGVWEELVATADIIDTNVLKFFAEYPNYLANVEETLAIKDNDLGLLDAFKYVFANAVAERIIAFRDYDLQDAMERAKQLEEWAKEEER